MTTPTIERIVKAIRYVADDYARNGDHDSDRIADAFTALADAIHGESDAAERVDAL
jgi:hypothetical protein